MTGLALVTAPTELPLDLDMAKAHLRVDSNDEDELIVELIEAAVDYIDGYRGVLGRCIMTQTWDLFLDGWPCDGNIKIPLPPLQSVTFVKYRNTAGTWITVDPSAYEVDNHQTFGWVVPSSAGWSYSLYNGKNVVNVRFVAGYGSTPYAVPPLLRHALKTMIGDAYEQRESYVTGTIFTETPAIKRALAPLRLVGM